MDREALLMTEYQILRGEIKGRDDVQRTALRFTLLAAGAIPALGLIKQELPPFFFLLPFCVFVPMAVRIYTDVADAAKRSAYLAVYIESQLPQVRWETRNGSLRQMGPKEKRELKQEEKYIRWAILGCLLLVAAIVCLFVRRYLAEHSVAPVVKLQLLSTVLLLVYEGLVCRWLLSFHRMREVWVHRWEMHRALERRDAGEGQQP